MYRISTYSYDLDTSPLSFQSLDEQLMSEVSHTLDTTQNVGALLQIALHTNLTLNAQPHNIIRIPRKILILDRPNYHYV